MKKHLLSLDELRRLKENAMKIVKIAVLHYLVIFFVFVQIFIIAGNGINTQTNKQTNKHLMGGFISLSVPPSL